MAKSLGAIRSCEQLRENFADHSSVCFGIGVSAVHGRRLDEAVQWFERAVDISPDFVEVHQNLAAAYKEQLRIPEMIGALQNVVKIGDPKNPAVQMASDSLRNMDESFRKEDGTGLDGFLAGHRHFDQGIHHMDNGNWEDAIAGFEKALEYNPNSPQY